MSLRESWILRPILKLYQKTPTILKVGIDFTFTIAAALLLSAIRTLILYGLIYLGWPVKSKMTTDAAASLVSMLHALYLCACLATLLLNIPGGWRSYIPSCKMSSHKQSKDWQDAASACLELCTGYMLFDASWLVIDSHQLGLVLNEFDCMILGHHILTSLYMTSCRVIQAGHLSAMILMLLGEMTNPVMNGFFVTRFAIQLECCSSENVLLVHTLLEHIHAVTYVIARLFIAPIFALHNAWDLLFTRRGRENIPLPLSLIWVSMAMAVLIGSIPFALEAVDMLRDGWDLKYPPNYDFGERYGIRGEL